MIKQLLEPKLIQFKSEKGNTNYKKKDKERNTEKEGKQLLTLTLLIIIGILRIQRRITFVNEMRNLQKI